MKDYTIQCVDCLCILGISKKKTWDKETRCMKCAKIEINIHQEKNDKSVEPKGSPIVKDEASTAKSSGDGGSLGDTAGCPGVDSRLAKGDTSDSTLPADLNSYKCGHKTNGVIIMDDNLLSMSAYIQWAEEEKNLETKKECFDCYLKKLDGKDS